MMREWLDKEVEDICTELGITATNCSVMLSPVRACGCAITWTATGLRAAMKVGLDCKEVSRLISEGLDQAMPAPEHARLRYHFVICQTCRTVDEQMKFLRRAVKEMDKEPPPDA